jgi:urease accessory protein
MASGTGMDTDTIMTTDASLSLLRLLQLVSPSLPIGAFAYSQGLEWAVEAGWVCDQPTLEDWLSDQLQQSLTWVDLPLLLRMLDAASRGDMAAMAAWIDELIALRETAELRAEEANRGRALAELLDGLGLLDTFNAGGATRMQPAPPTSLGPSSPSPAPDWKPLLSRSQLAGFALAATAWEIDQSDVLAGYAWSWAENLTLAGIKLVPLGQTAGQRILTRLAGRIPAAVEQARDLPDTEIGASMPALAIASSLHETQYTRLYRS